MVDDNRNNGNGTDETDDQINLLRNVEQSAGDLVKIIADIKKNVDPASLPDKLKERFLEHERKLSVYLGLIQQKSEVTNFYDQLKSEFGIEDSVSFEEGMVTVALDYQENVAAIASILSSVTDNVEVDGEKVIIDGKRVVEKDYFAHVPRLVILLEENYERLNDQVEKMHTSDEVKELIKKQIGPYKKQVSDLEEELNDKIVDNWGKNHEVPDDGKRKKKKPGRFARGLRRVVVGGTLVAMIVGAAVGGSYLNETYGKKSNGEKIVYKECGGCGDFIFNYHGLLAELGNLIDVKNQSLVDLLGCKPVDEKEEKKDEKAAELKPEKKGLKGVLKDNIPNKTKTEQKTETKEKPKTTAVSFSGLDKDSYIEGKEIRPVFAIENVDDCSELTYVVKDSRNLEKAKSNLSCNESLCHVNIPELKPGKYKLLVSCQDKNLPDNKNNVDQEYSIDVVAAEKVDKRELTLKSLSAYSVKIGSRFNGEFSIVLSDMEHIPELITTSFYISSSRFTVRKKEIANNRITYSVTSDPITNIPTKKYRISICFDDVGRKLCYAEDIRILKRKKIE